MAFIMNNRGWIATAIIIILGAIIGIGFAALVVKVLSMFLPGFMVNIITGLFVGGIIGTVFFD